MRSNVLLIMKTIATPLLIALIVQVSPLAADSIRVEHGYISITVERGEKPYKIGGASFGTASEAARFLTYIDLNWPGGPRPTVVVDYRDMSVPKGDEEFKAALVRVEGSAHWKVIRMPSPRGAIQESWVTLAMLEKQWAEQDGTGQPATRPESKSEGGDKPQPEAEGRSQ